VTYETADDVLEHFGVRGMHWGVRRDGTKRSGKDKAIILAAAGAAFVVSRRLMMNVPMTAVVTGASSLAAASVLDRSGRTPMSDIQNRGR
jgi:NhaP-type Na+/H+ or K+/H+ antiporter